MRCTDISNPKRAEMYSTLISRGKKIWEYFFSSKTRFKGTQQNHQANPPVLDFYAVKYLDKK